jgi:DNA-binding transcriptional ArsR family regulator
MEADPNTGRSTPPSRRPPAREPLSERAIELTAQRLGVVATARRIALLEALTHGEAGVQELADRVGLPHQNVSHNLTLLWRAGILTRRSEGKSTLYAIEDWGAWWVVEQVARLVQSSIDERDAQPSAA